MKLTTNLTFISLIAFAVSKDSIGTLTVTLVDKSIINHSVKLDNEVLHEGDSPVAVTTDDDDNIVIYPSMKPLGVNDGNKLTVGEYPTRLSLEMEVSEDRWLLQANGATVFQLCGDGSIGLNSDCQGAKKAFLHFEALF